MFKFWHSESLNFYYSFVFFLTIKLPFYRFLYSLSIPHTVSEIVFNQKKSSSLNHYSRESSAKSTGKNISLSGKLTAISCPYHNANSEAKTVISNHRVNLLYNIHGWRKEKCPSIIPHPDFDNIAVSETSYRILPSVLGKGFRGYSALRFGDICQLKINL